MTLPKDDTPLENVAAPDGTQAAKTEPELEGADAYPLPALQTDSTETKPKRLSLRPALTGVVVGLCYAALFLSGGEAAVFALAGLEIVPFLVLAVLAYAAADRRWLKGITLVYWLVLVGGIGALCFVFGFVGVVDPKMELVVLTSTTDDVPIPPLTSEHLIRIGFAAISVFVSFLLGLLCFLPAVRRVFARFIDIDSHSFVHATAVATAVATSLLLITPLLVSNQPPILALVGAEAAAELSDAGEQLRGSVYILIWTVPASLLAVGFPRKRTLKEALRRLGLVSPSRRNLVCAVILSVVLVFIAHALDMWSTRLWQAMGWQTTDQDAVWKLFSFALGPVGAVIVAVTAGVGEELVFRGVLQPRIGIILSSLLFTSVHAFQYNFDALVQVLLLSFIFGIVRKFSNTSTSALIHGGYDFIAFLGM